MLARHAHCRLAALVAALTFAGPNGCRGDRFWDGCLSVETRLGWIDTGPNSDPKIALCRNSPFDVLDAAHIRRLELIAGVIADPTSFSDLNETEAFLRTANRTVLNELNTTFNVLDFSSSSISNINDGTFADLDTVNLNLSHCQLAHINTATFLGLSVSVLDLSYNVLSHVDARAFDGLGLTVLDLGHNDLRTLVPYLFAGMVNARIYLEQNNISNVLRDAWSAVTVFEDLRMHDNPSVCALANGAVACQCDRSGAGDASPPFCISCPDTLEVSGIEWRGIYPEEMTNSTEQQSLLAHTLGFMQDQSNEFLSSTLLFTCGNGAIEGQECTITCRPGFVGTPVTYQCAGSGDWETPNRTSPTCIMYAESQGSSNETNGTAIQSAVAGNPFTYPPPMVYGTDIEFDSDGLPSGVTMDRNGRLRGIPTEHGNFSVTIYAVDNFGTLTPAASFLLVVAPPLTASSRKLVTAHIGSRFEWGSSLDVRGGQPPFVFYQNGDLPRGLQLSNWNGLRPLISGIPTEEGTFRITLFVTDGANTTRDWGKITLTVHPADVSTDFKAQFFIALALSVILTIISLVLMRKQRRMGQETVESVQIAAKIADLERGSPHPSQLEGTRRRWNWRLGPSRRPMRAITLSHMDSVQEQATLFHDPDAGYTDTSSLKSVSSQIGTTGYDRCCVGTRIYRRDPKAPLDQSSLVPLEMFLAKASFYSRHILVAAPVNDVNLCTGIEDLLRRCRTNPAGQDYVGTELVKIPYWGKFTPPLNILLRHATLNKDRCLLFQSVEVLAEQRAVTTLLSHMDDKTLVAGLALEHSHRFCEGVQPLTGLTCPWNTFAVWNVEKLGRTGFLPISDGVPPLTPEAAGVEELAAIALIQMLFPMNAAAKLLKVHSSLYSWDINFKCEARLALHQKKMKSKLDRPKRQLLAMGEISSGQTLHIDTTKIRIPEPAPVSAASGVATGVANDYLIVASADAPSEQQDSAPLLDTSAAGDESIDLGSPLDEFTSAELLETSQL